MFHLFNAMFNRLLFGACRFAGFTANMFPGVLDALAFIGLRLL